MNNLGFLSATVIKENKDLFACYVAKTYIETNFMQNYYPTYFDWLFKTVIPGIFDGTRNIFYATYKDEIVGILIAKKTKAERKISTLWVKPYFRNNGIATQLLYYGFMYLGTTTPIFTVNEKRRMYFDGIIKRFDWIQTSKFLNPHTDSFELVYNEKDEKLKIIDEDTERHKNRK